MRFLEQGRAVPWSQSLHLVSDVARLVGVDSTLASHLAQVRDELNSLEPRA
ncbi:hypothetical protein GCM10010306_103380 [Streptomyces umbrinus]|uniref:hypothetical protein n=1 Tax=Streptomyces umbrinus TaxID=67370 RepID=UPI001676F287|nr:hypothetical protein [Streptomyces umbrinus]GHB91544.1 hypothetical protein GCM10010306_103380 [Streptomyces umbrinus]